MSVGDRVRVTDVTLVAASALGREGTVVATKEASEMVRLYAAITGLPEVEELLAVELDDYQREGVNTSFPDHPTAVTIADWQVAGLIQEIVA